MVDFPRSLLEFQRQFPDDAACAAYLAETRWPEGFVCPECGHGKAWRLDSKAWTYECSRRLIPLSPVPQSVVTRGMFSDRT